MKTRALISLLFVFFTVPIPAIAEENYSVAMHGTAGGTSSQANSINNRGWAAGAANLAGDQFSHAVVWDQAQQIDLGTLGGENSGVFWPVKNDRGTVAGISETAEENPLGELFSCAFFFPTDFTARTSRPVCRGFRWENGVMTALETLGGYDSYATGSNNAGQTVGWAETLVHDSTCVFPQALQFKAVLWDRDGKAHELPPLPGDTTSAATAINDKGQVVGISGACGIAVGGVSAAHAVIWENGVPADIGNLGGHQWNTPTAINNQATVVGFSLLAGQDGTRNYEAFVWTKEDGIHSLGKPAGDIRSAAFGINDKGQIVGLSRGGPFVFHALLWENGVMIDLNARTVAGSPFLLYANDINDRGEIAGQALDLDSSETRGFTATPTRAAAGAPAISAKHGPGLMRDISRELRRRFLIDLGDE
jgi:probable HAF family extracellular repeat protein